MQCECEHNYAAENVYNTVREYHQNRKTFLDHSCVKGLFT